MEATNCVDNAMEKSKVKEEEMRKKKSRFPYSIIIGRLDFILYSIIVT